MRAIFRISSMFGCDTSEKIQGYHRAEVEGVEV